ncbi:unnamed protein product [Bathycoccus prasinos]
MKNHTRDIRMIYLYYHALCDDEWVSGTCCEKRDAAVKCHPPNTIENRYNLTPGADVFVR